MSGTQFATFAPQKQASILHVFMDLFKGNDRGYGVGEFVGVKQRESDNKWTPGHTRWTWGQPGEEQYGAHLRGDYLTGIGVLCDNGSVWFSCLDIDEYEIDYSEVMSKVKRAGLPLVVFRTKSGGLRICIFFTEPIEADVVISRMHKLSASLGYAGCEIFPKQTKLLVEKGDCPSWIYLPYGGTGDVFPEQGCMNDMGNLMEISEAMAHCTDLRIDRSQFLNLFAAEKAADANGKKNGKKHPNGVWVNEGDKQDIIDEMFHDGPVCLRILSRLGIHQGQQNHALAHCATFLKKKYENWDKALEWVNYNVLVPVGDIEKLQSIIKRWENNKYEYQCHEEPMRSFCDSLACREKKYGVGSDMNITMPELGMTIINRKPRMFIISVGEIRIQMEATQLINQNMFQNKFLEEGITVPHQRKKEEHSNWINMQMASATVVEPSYLMRTNATELEIFERFLGWHLKSWVRRGMIPKETDIVRAVPKEKRFYFKWKDMESSLRKNMLDREIPSMRIFIENNCTHHKDDSRGRWWRYTYSISFDKFDEDMVNEWMSEDDETPAKGE